MGAEDAGGVGVGEAPREPGYVSYVLVLLFTGFLDDKS